MEWCGVFTIVIEIFDIEAERGKGGSSVPDVTHLRQSAPIRD
jgi:hypothetical protein